MDYEVDLDPTHRVLRLSLTTSVVTLELAEDCYIRLSRIASNGGPYAAIYDMSRVVETTISTDMVRNFARRPPSVPPGRPQVLVGKQPSIYGLARVFHISEEFRGLQFEVVWSLAEAYDIVGASAEDFTQRLFPEELAA
jgi:hypothetical protein